MGRKCPEPGDPGQTKCTTTGGGVIYSDIPATHHHAARSRHPGGVNAALCDGSVHFYFDSTDLVVWRAMSSAQGDDIVDVGDF